jgi:hypothetical protein
MPAEVAQNAYPNVWSLTSHQRVAQWTDTATGIVSPVVLRQERPAVAFVTYYKGQNGLHDRA